MELLAEEEDLEMQAEKEEPHQEQIMEEQDYLTEATAARTCLSVPAVVARNW